MKSWKILSNSKLIKALNQRGQSLVEFVLLLAVITGLSYGFVATMNANIVRVWEYSANLVLHDKPGVKTLEL